MEWTDFLHAGGNSGKLKVISVIFGWALSKIMLEGRSLNPPVDTRIRDYKKSWAYHYLRLPFSQTDITYSYKRQVWLSSQF